MHLAFFTQSSLASKRRCLTPSPYMCLMNFNGGLSLVVKSHRGFRYHLLGPPWPFLSEQRKFAYRTDWVSGFPFSLIALRKPASSESERESYAFFRGLLEAA